MNTGYRPKIEAVVSSLILLAERSDVLLVILPSVPAAIEEGRYIFDEKAVSGLELYLKFWRGPIRCIFRQGSRSDLLFGREYHPDNLPFEAIVVPANTEVPDALISDASVVLASGDNWLDFPLAEQGSRLGVPVCFVIEYILETRLQILKLSDAPLVPKVKSFVWTIMMEAKRRLAFARSSGIQSNGTPAAAAYGKLSNSVLTFFDTRLAAEQIATDEQLIAKQKKIMAGAPLRLAFTGRFERMKGADDLIKIASRLDRAGIDFCLDIYGSGSLEPDMSALLNATSTSRLLKSKVRIHKPIDFNHELVPLLRSKIDLFLCCHRQSDPSCTYLETLGCGVPIVGYGNRAWDGILKQADVGWITPINGRDEFVKKIAGLNANRSEIVNKMWNARNFARAHCAETEFESRVGQLLRLTEQGTAYANRKA